ncbi:MAG: DUF4783 domain-containing protein [Rhodothermia bacterium]
MALIIPFVGAMLVGMARGASAQDLTDPNAVASLVAGAIESGDSRTLAELSVGQVELDLGEGSSVYSRDQARYVFTSFFEDHPPSDVSLGEVSVLESLGTARGRYSSLDSNQQWDVFIRLGSSRGAWKLKEVRLTHAHPPPHRAPSLSIPQLPPR